MVIKREEGHTLQIYIQNWCGDPPPTSLGTQESKPPRPSSFYIPRVPALLHLHLALQSVASPNPSGDTGTQTLRESPFCISGPNL